MAVRHSRRLFASSFACLALIGTFGGCSDDSGPRVIGSDKSLSQEATQEDEPSSDGAEAAEFEVQSGFTSAKDSIGTGYTTAGARVTNPNTDAAAYDVQILFNLVGKNGDVLDTQTENVRYVPPGGSLPVAPLQIGFDLKDEPAKLEVQVVGDFSEDDGPHGPMGGDGAFLEVKGARLEQSDFGTELTAQVTNPTDAVAEYASWSCIYLQGQKIVGGSSSTIIDPIPPGATVQFGESLAFELQASKVQCQALVDL